MLKQLSFKSILITLNCILLITLAIVYFSSHKKETNDLAIKKVNGNLTIAFINSDSIMTHYDLVKNVRALLENKKNKLEADILSKQNVFQEKVNNYQDNLKRNAITAQQAQQAEKKLMEERQAILELSDQYTQELAQEELAMNVQIQDSIIHFLKRFNKKYGFDYVLGYSHGGGILLANDTLDITSEVLNEINKEYNSYLTKK